MKVFVHMVGFQVVRNLNCVFHLHQLLVETDDLPDKLSKNRIRVQPWSLELKHSEGLRMVLEIGCKHKVGNCSPFFGRVGWGKDCQCMGTGFLIYLLHWIKWASLFHPDSYKEKNPYLNDVWISIFNEKTLSFNLIYLMFWEFHILQIIDWLFKMQNNNKCKDIINKWHKRKRKSICRLRTKRGRDSLSIQLRKKCCHFCNKTISENQHSYKLSHYPSHFNKTSETCA